MTNCKLNPHIEKYLVMVESESIRTCKRQKKLALLIRKCFAEENLYVDDERIENYLGLAKYFPFEKIFEWQAFVLSLHLCVFREDGLPRWPDLFCMIGRGAGKDGTIALEAVCLMSPYNGIEQYDVDICANNEEQAMRPVQDITNAFESPENCKKLKRYFYWTKEKVTCLKTKSVLRGRTNSPKGKDGLRSGVVVFNEIHQYQNYDNINVFTTGLGKKKHPRRSYYTTNGDVRDGPLDNMLEMADGILFNGDPDNGLLPFICTLDSKEEVHEPANWEKANPSLPYLPSLREETRKEYEEWRKNPEHLPAFMTKRMNIPETNRELAVAEWENIKASEKELPDLEGWNCTLGLDFVKVGDFASANLHFRNNNLRYDINHSWLCLNSADLPRLRCPWKEWARNDLLTIVDEKEINPELICEWIVTMSSRYNIVKIALDNFRYGFMRSYLKQIGFDADVYKNVSLVRPSDIMKVVPVIDSCFNNQYFIWGENPVLRWGVNNTMKKRCGRNMGFDTGNYIYTKIEGRSRKTDPFMALVASMTIESELGDGGRLGMPDLGIITF